MKCFHHNDLDGRCAGAIVRRGRPNSTPSDFIEIDYKIKPDLSVVSPDEEVFIVDFSFKPEDMDALLEKTANAIWIDHHSTASSYPYAHLAQNPVKGLRDFTVKGLSGCELTWKFLFPEEELPDAVQLIGDYDSWRMKLAPSCLEFYEGMKLEDNSPSSLIWKHLFGDPPYDSKERDPSVPEETVEETKASGRSCIKYRDAYCKEMRQSFGYETELTHDKHIIDTDGTAGIVSETTKVYALNVYRFGSQAYGDLINKYPVVIAYVHDGEQYTVSLYSTRDDVHCGEICKAIGNGGGHKGAAGFVCKELPFKRTMA